MVVNGIEKGERIPQMPARSTVKDGLQNKLEFYALTNFASFWRFVQRVPWLERPFNRILIDRAVTKTKPRPHQFSTMTPYTSWDSLTDRTYSGRHLPVADPTYLKALPPVEHVVDLFRRPAGGQRNSDKSTLLFSHFAQWFTDGFLRTDRQNQLKNTSNHEIDLSPLYGIHVADTMLLRSRVQGRLKSQQINGEEYPPYYFMPNGDPAPEFKGLNILVPTLPKPLPLEQRIKLFAMGVERANNQIGYVMLNTLFLREHNRLCSELSAAHPGWDDERLFQTARNIVIVLLIKIVIEEYINHIAPYYFKFRANPSSFWQSSWYRANWMTIEFNLLYRWHSLVTDTVLCGGKEISTDSMQFNNDLLTSRGLAAWFSDSSRHVSGEIGLFNTPNFLIETELASLKLGRCAGLRSYNDYRVAFGYPRVTDFKQISDRDEVVNGLRNVYGRVEQIELYAGLFAEDVREHSALSPLIGRMVGVDAFSQALTNPLLSIHVFNETTFSEVGWRTIQSTKRLEDIVRRNLPSVPDNLVVSFTQPGKDVR